MDKLTELENELKDIEDKLQNVLAQGEFVLTPEIKDLNERHVQVLREILYEKSPTFYTTHCPQCKVLKTKLDKAGIVYNECDDVDLMLSKGIKACPQLELADGTLLGLKPALDWIKEARIGEY